jgi:hypothetical protein
VPLCINGQTGAKKKCCFSFGKRQNAILLEELRVFVFFFPFSLFRMMAKAGLEKNKRKNRTLMTTNEWIIVACGGPLSQQKSEFDIETLKPHARITRQLIRHITSQLRSLTDNLFLLVPPDPCNAFFLKTMFFRRNAMLCGTVLNVHSKIHSGQERRRQH